MGNVIFVRTAHEYPSYTDFWHLVELSGYATCHAPDIDYDSDNLYIAAPLNGELIPSIGTRVADNRTAKIWLWNLERPGKLSTQNFASENYKLLRAGIFDSIFVSDRKLAMRTKLRFVQMGSHEGLGKPGYSKNAAMIHLSCYSWNRRAIFVNPYRQKTMIGAYKVAVNSWGKERHAALQSTRYMLSLHQDEHQYIEPLRYSLAASYGLPLLAESVHDAGVYSPYMRQLSGTTDRDALIANLRLAIGDMDGQYSELSAEFRHVMTTENSFKNLLEKVL